MDENTRKRFQIPEGAMRRIKKADSDDASRFVGESEVIKAKKPEKK